MKLREARLKAGLTQQQMSEKFEIPKRTIENWEAEKRNCPRYVEKLIIEKLEEIIMMNGKEVLENAKKMNKYDQHLPEVEIGDIVEINDIWDGEGEEYNVLDEDEGKGSYSYKITDDGFEGEGNQDVWINYEYELIEKKDEFLDTLVKITNIELL